MPLCGLTVSVPARPLPPARARVTGSLALTTVFPLASSTATLTAGEIVAFATEFEGCSTKASFTGVGSFPVMVSVEEATALCDPFRTAIAWTVDVAAIEIAPA
jgi:hypothetical protein